MGVKPALILFAESLVFEQRFEPGRRGHARAEGLVQNVRDLHAHVDSDFVQERNWTDGKAPGNERRVDLLDRYAFDDQEGGLAQVRAENARSIEARAVTDHDHRL